MAMGQQEQLAMGLGHWGTWARATGVTGGNGNDNGNGDRSIIAIAIDRAVCVPCAVWMWGAPTRSTFIPCVLFEKVSECQKEVRINE
jgi:hypothetical protein